MDQNSSRPGIPTSDERTWGMIAHLSAFVGFLAPVLGSIIGPLVVWLAKRDRSPFIEAQAKEALNFNISVAIGLLICSLLALIFVGVLLGALLFIAWLVLTIVAAIRAGEGIDYRYPFSLRLIK